MGCIRYVVEQAGANSFFDDFLSRWDLLSVLTRVIATPTDYSDKAFHKGYSTKVPLNSEITVYFTLYHI